MMPAHQSQSQSAPTIDTSLAECGIVHVADIIAVDAAGQSHRYHFRWTCSTWSRVLRQAIRYGLDDGHPLNLYAVGMWAAHMISAGLFPRAAAEAVLADELTRWAAARAARAEQQPEQQPEQSADAGREGAAPTTGLPSAVSGQGSAGIEARARWSRRARFLLRGLRAVGQGAVVGGAIAWLVHSLRLWGN